jgi:hypothetical protein
MERAAASESAGGAVALGVPTRQVQRTTYDDNASYVTIV